MTSADWTRLGPHRPLDKQTMSLYVPRPEGGAARLLQLVRAGSTAIAVVGPMGSGKSTELFAAAADLAEDPDHFVSIFPLDHVEASVYAPKAIHLQQGSIWAFLAISLARHAEGRKVTLSTGLLRKLRKASDTVELAASGQSEDLMVRLRKIGDALAGDADLRGEDLLLETLREVRRASGQKTFVIICDGLEKIPVERARELLEGLLRFRSEASLVAVVPTALVVGPGSYEVLSNFKVFPVRPVAVHDEGSISGRDGRDFLKAIVLRRSHMDTVVPPDLDLVLDRAAEASGGVPRAFLQLVQDAAMYARLSMRERPTLEDLGEAMGDHAESMRRLLVKGDVDALRAADGTDGLEVDPERRLRFLTHGLLLEYKLNDRIVVHPAPLLAGILARSGQS